MDARADVQVVPPEVSDEDWDELDCELCSSTLLATDSRCAICNWMRPGRKLEPPVQVLLVRKDQNTLLNGALGTRKK